VYNKIDKLDRKPRLTNNRAGEGRAVWLSAANGDGISLLLEAISARLQRKTLHGQMHLLPTQGRQRARLFEIGAVLNEEACDDGGWNLELKMAETDLRRFLKREKLSADLLEPMTMHASATAVN